jgi:hypothetical protein
MAEIPPEEGSGSLLRRRTPEPSLEEEAPEEITEAEEDEDHRGDDSGDQGHHREQFGTGAFRP